MEIQNSESDKTYLKRRKIFSAVSLVVLIAVFTAVTAMLWRPLTGTFQHPEQFRAWVVSNGLRGKLAFVGIDMLQVVFAAIPGEPVELGAGYAFGALEGLVLCLVGDAVGTVVVFAFTKRFGNRLVEVLIGREKIRSLRFMKNRRNLNLLVFLLFFIPGTPKDIFTYFIGLTPMKLGTFLLVASIGRIPSILTSTITGDALGVQDYRTAIIVYAVTGVISASGILIYRRLSSKSKEMEPSRLVESKDSQSSEETK